MALSDINQGQTPLLDALRASGQRPHAPFYAPGHKRGQGASASLRALVGVHALGVDVPELPDLDNLFAPEGVILEAQTLAAAAFGAEQTYFLANGSTCGLEAAILATCGPGDRIIVPRNVHRSVLAGLVLAGAMPVYVQPDYAPGLGLALGVAPATIVAALEQYADVRAVLVVSPTYHGICSDIAAIASLTHSHGIPLVVDEAHGPHFAFHPELPTPALAQGADLVVQSTHKVLGALTQASMLHTQGDRIDQARLQAALQLTQSTSPSYLLLASLDAARHQMATAGEALLGQTLALAQGMRSQLVTIPGLAVMDQESFQAYPSVAALDLTRLTVDVSGLGLSGLEADDILHNELGVTAELPELRHLTFIVSLGNTPTDGQQCIAGFRTLVQGQAQRGKEGVPRSPLPDYPTQPITLPSVSPRQAFFAQALTVTAAEAVGRLSAETISAYPPGIPTLVAGEPITAAALDYLITTKQQGGYVTGCSDASLATFRVLP
jgi:arginine decarboxylase